MREDPEGYNMLENICQMKIAEHIDDTLFVHTNLTSEMSQMICLKGVDWINTVYEQGLRDLLLSDVEPSPSYQEVANIFLHVYNRHYLSSNEAAVLRRQGFNRVIHGHIDNNGTLEMIGELEIYSVDRSAGKRGNNMSERSIAVIKRDSDIKLGWDAEYL